ncbi:hypothetical protein CHS0354_016715 [Potamilus streckersoni]|uniref:Uncharacterized protein n=1 Tax=Potamilus streckersoni TaxID=2493646 RepID=A0AAE0TC77_9BIVA|nr:hypothetical protein CHS0354_016715 [Potamilus streckersoni]
MVTFTTSEHQYMSLVREGPAPHSKSSKLDCNQTYSGVGEKQELDCVILTNVLPELHSKIVIGLHPRILPSFPLGLRSPYATPGVTGDVA